jgi:hypothetical protein
MVYTEDMENLERENQQWREVANRLAATGQLVNDWCPASYRKHWVHALAAYQALSDSGGKNV